MAALVLFQVGVVDIGQDFSDPTARAGRLTVEEIEVTLTVRTQPGVSVVAHLIDPGGEQMTLAMADSNNGIYEGTFDTRPIDLVVVFEAIRGRESVQSTPVRLTQIGLSASDLAPRRFPDPEPADQTRWIWLALGAGATALALVALAFLPKRRPDTAADVDQPEGASAGG